ncbi:response regulator transcription factor [Planctomycetales bacterium ZRK34]|nr:response regulator transcription factor [Planctomycetales bacterium ZRK34]
MGQDVRILIADDHPIVRRGLVELLEQESDFQIVAEVESGQQTMRALREQPVDLSIVDLSLKDISGIELIKQIKAQYEDMPVLVLSMHDETIYANRALRAGAAGYIMKQEGTEKLIEAIRIVLSGDVYVSSRMTGRLLSRMIGRDDPVGETPADCLSDRELEVFELLGQGLGTRQIAQRLHVSIKTIESHRERIKQKLKLANANELVQHATQWVMRETGAVGD